MHLRQTQGGLVRSDNELRPRRFGGELLFTDGSGWLVPRQLPLAPAQGSGQRRTTSRR
jgi:hypothetical protein